MPMNSDMSFLEQLQTADIWDRMKHISLEEMKTVTLMSRIDTKYVTHQNKLLPILERAIANKYMVQFTTCALNGYSTTYYDTQNMEMYLMHHNKKLHRQKIRCRTYTDAGISFLEIKDKSNKGRTNKIRMPVRETNSEQLKKDAEAIAFISSHTRFDLPRLIPSVVTDFYRITLVNVNKTERITIDVNLTFKNITNNNEAALTNLIIIELKQDGRFISTMKQILSELRVKPFHVSKYCIGTAMTDTHIKSNRFKRKLHLMNKIKNNYE